MNEWGFAAELKSWWDSAFADHPDWGLSRCEVENQVDGGLQRSDLIVWSDTDTVALAGELRLPDHDRPSPYDLDNLTGSIEKATQRGAPWAFTSDGVALLLVDMAASGRPLERIKHRSEGEGFSSRSQLDNANIRDRVRAGWLAMLSEIAPVIVGLSAPEGVPPDDVFIRSLRALLAGPVAAIEAHLTDRRAVDPAFEADLIRWMVDAQGWVHDPADWPAEISRVARMSAYVFATRLLFYQALRRARPELSPIHLDPDTPAAVARTSIRTWFGIAIEASGDYRTLLDWDPAAEFSLAADPTVHGWSRVLAQLAAFDLSHLNYDVVGRIFERLIEPQERYRWGQHYTQSDVVDLMLSFALPGGAGPILDPALGGGTFLVRAYERMAHLQPATTHQDRLADLYGVDVSSFAATLATLNLATRHLAFEDNYPRVASRSFFQVSPDAPLMELPRPGTHSAGDQIEVIIPPLRAVACNPPYVRRQGLSADRLNEARHVLANRSGHAPAPTEVSRLANYHVYFWFHAARFLGPDGRLAFIAAGEWMDSDYGVALQKWLLDYFTIDAVIESHAEPWFSEARVGTAVVVATLCGDADARRINRVRFVTLRRPLRDLCGQSNEDGTHLQAIDRLRDRILNLADGHGESDDLDWSVIRQGELRSLGEEAMQ